MRDFRLLWDRITSGIKTGSGKNGKLHFHDLRRSSITRMHSAGISESDAQAIAGHLTTSVHRRYRQMSEWDAKRVAAKIDPDVK